MEGKMHGEMQKVKCKMRNEGQNAKSGLGQEWAGSLNLASFISHSSFCISHFLLNLSFPSPFHWARMLRVAEPERLPVAQARAGAAAAWRVLFRRYQLPLYAYVHELVRHEQTSLDLVQASFVRAARHLGSLRDDAKFGSWLFGIAHQQCLQHFRQAGREFVSSDLLDEQPGDDPGPDQMLLRAEQAAEFRALLAQLPPAHRAVLVLYFIEDFSLEDIARVTDAPLGTVKSRLHHAKRTLKKLWEHQA
jgi:RNA polymerase sigma-70 factor, ECF subfamily